MGNGSFFSKADWVKLISFPTLFSSSKWLNGKFYSWIMNEVVPLFSRQWVVRILLCRRMIKNVLDETKDIDRFGNSSCVLLFVYAWWWYLFKCLSYQIRLYSMRHSRRCGLYSVVAAELAFGRKYQKHVWTERRTHYRTKKIWSSVPFYCRNYSAFLLGYYVNSKHNYKQRTYLNSK